MTKRLLDIATRHDTLLRLVRHLRSRSIANMPWLQERASNGRGPFTQMQKVKGMVQLAGITYRIVRVQRGAYNVVRIRDDQTVGHFQMAPVFELTPSAIELDLLREIARLAIHTAKTSYIAFPRPEAAAVAAAEARRSPSTMPPPAPAGN